MEFLLLPNNRGNPPIPVPRTPYVCRERYDGGPFLSYPNRAGKPEAAVAYSDPLKYQLTQLAIAPSIQDQESFVQTWLYFGFIAELLCATSTEPPNDTSAELGASAPRTVSKEIMDQIYETLVIKDGTEQYVRLCMDSFKRLFEIAKPRMPNEEDLDGNKKYYYHVITCLKRAEVVWNFVPDEFNHTVKVSIAALAEFMGHTIQNELHKLRVQFLYGVRWTKGYLGQDAKDSMIAHGWCPSDITRAQAKFHSIQTLHIIRMMDKSLSKRDHHHCTDFSCKFGQIDMNYQLSHQQENCTCEPLLVQEHVLNSILEKEDRFPLVRLNGDLHCLSADIVEYAPGIPYVAISHVWADELVSKFDVGEDPQNKSPLIWLDTLCCPAKDGAGKKRAIEKIRLVYQQAKHVLVLDAGLMAYESQSQTIPEKLVRIFTSSWMRRLWTLQEGALAKSLYFQFADEALPLYKTRQIFNDTSSPQLHMFCKDVNLENWRLDAFFRADQHSSMIGDFPDLFVLDQALQYRSVSVESDEALCIGTLMSLDLREILHAPEENRMQTVWKLLAIKKRGIPADIIFFEESRLTTPGWTWAPRSLLTMQYSVYEQTDRVLRWSGPQRGIPDDLGLRVQYGGYRISVVEYADSRPRNPWPGFVQVPKYRLLFRDTEGHWNEISSNRGLLSAEERQSHNDKMGMSPFHDVADTTRGVILLRQVEKNEQPSNGIFAEATTNEPGHGIPVKTKCRILFRRLYPEEMYIYETIHQLALRLRSDEITDQHLKIYDDFVKAHDNSGDYATMILENEEFKASKEALRKRMKEMVAEVVTKDNRFVEAVKAFMGEDCIEYVWGLIRDWFNHDYTGEKIGEEQTWFVD